MQLEEKECLDKKYSIRHEELASSDIVLLHDIRRKEDMSYKLTFKWLGSDRISDTIKDKNIYILEKLDGSWLISIIMGDRFRKFHLL